jgi:multiple sugar transport system substrate-binding protein
MQRSHLRLSLVLGAALALAAPGGAAIAQSPPAEAETVVLNLVTGFTGGDRQAYEDLVAQFNASHPDIEVRMDVQPWDTIKTTVPAAFATGQGPDIVTPDFNPGTVLEYANAGTLLPLDGLMGTGEDQIDPAALPAEVVAGNTVDGTVYAVPANLATLMLYYNVALLSEAGLDAPPATMEEFRSYAVQLTDQEAGQYGVALADHATIAMWPILIWADGGDIVGADGCSMLDDPATIEAVRSWADLVVNEGISPVGLTGQEADNLVAAGRAAMEMNGPWATGTYTAAGLDYDVAPIPQGSAGQVTLAASVPFVVNSATQHPEAAFTFLAWWNSQEAQKALALGSGFPPTRADMGDDPELAENPWVAKFAAAVPYSRPYLANVPNFTQVDEIFSTAIGQITRGGDAEAVLTDAAAQMNTLLGCAQ